MAKWLLKTEPGCYQWADLMRDRKAVWDGVSNALALKHIRAMQKGDLAIIYHTGDQRQAVGVAQVISEPYADPDQDDERLAVVDIKPLKAFKRPITLDAIKADPAFSGWDLLRISRLSVVPVPDAMWKRLEQLAEED